MAQISAKAPKGVKPKPKFRRAPGFEERISAPPTVPEGRSRGGALRGTRLPGFEERIGASEERVEARNEGGISAEELKALIPMLLSGDKLSDRQEDFLKETAEAAGAMAGGGVGRAFGAKVLERVGGRALPATLKAARGAEEVPRFLAGRATREGAAITGSALGGATVSEGTSDEPLLAQTDTAKARRREALAVGAAGEAVGVALTPPLQGLARKGIQFAREAPVIGAVVRRIPFLGRGLDNVAPGSDEAVEILGERGLSPTLGQVSESFLVDTAENVAEAAFLGGGLVRGAKRRSTSEMLRGVAEMLDNFKSVASREANGALLQEALEGGSTAWRAITRKAHKMVDDALRSQSKRASRTRLITEDVPVLNTAGQPLVDPIDGPVTRRVTREVAEDVIENPVFIDNVLLQIEDRFGDLRGTGVAEIDTLFAILGKSSVKGRVGNALTFERAEAIRSAALEISRSAKRGTLPSSGPAMAKVIAQLMTEEMERTAAGLSGDALEAWIRARNLTKIGKETFNGKVLSSLMGFATPEQVTASLLRNNNPTQIRRVYQVLKDPRLRDEIFTSSGQTPEMIWANTQGEFLLAKRSAAFADEFGEEISARKFLKGLRSSGETFKALFPESDFPGMRQNILKLFRGLSRVQGPSAGTRSGAILIQLGQAGAVMQLAGGAFEGKGADATAYSFLLAPAALALFLRSPGLVELVVKGMTGKALGRTAARTLGEIGTRMAEAGIPYTIQGPDGLTKEINPKPQGPTPDLEGERVSGFLAEREATAAARGAPPGPRDPLARSGAIPEPISPFQNMTLPASLKPRPTPTGLP